MRIICLLLIGATLCGCATEPVKVDPPTESTRRSFESAIAEKLLRDLVASWPTIGDATRAYWLREQLEVFDRSVDLTLVSGGMRQEYELLTRLVEIEDTRTHSTNFISRTNALSSLDWSSEQYEAAVSNELARIGKQPPGSDGMTEFPDDSFEGRQAYLDTMADMMFAMQADWFDLLHYYETSSLALFGEESEDFMFRYNALAENAELTVNLASTQNLPLGEVRALSVYFGFPGLEALRGSRTSPMQSLFALPGFRYGWAGYILFITGEREKEYAAQYRRFEHLLAALAAVDLGVHTGTMSPRQAESYLAGHTPYKGERLQLHIREILAEPGRYLSALAGKVRFMTLYEAACPAGSDAGTGSDCVAGFNQQVIDAGIMPFDMLEARLASQD